MNKEAHEYYENLSDQQRIDFLARFIFHLSETARGSYPEAGVDKEQAIKNLRAFNEIVQVVSKQLLAALGIWAIRDAYPQDVFVDLIFRIAQRGDAQAQMDFQWAFAMSLSDIGVLKADA